MKRNFDPISYVKAREAQAAAALAKGDLSSLIETVNALQIQVANQANQIIILQNAFGAHTHPYTDIDQSGAVQNKQTDIPS